MSRRSWKRLEFRFPLKHQDILVGQLSVQACSGFIQEDDHLICFMEEHQWTPAVRRRIGQIIGRTREACPGVELSFKTRTVHDQNWNRRWERSVGIVDINDRIIVKPSWKKTRAKDHGKLTLHIDPKMSFGTGHHETTRLSLILLEQFIKPKARVLDFGTGTGILAIAAAKLGARRVIAYDNDEWSVDNARENVRKNKAGRIVSVRLGDQIPRSERPFDLIISNIDYPSLTAMLPKFAQSLKNQGVIIISGILMPDISPIVDQYQRKRFQPIELTSENGWVAIAFLKTHAPRRH